MSDILTDERVQEIVRACLFQENEDVTDAVIVEGVVTSFGFHPDRLAAHKPQILEFLGELSENFFVDKGGGWSFLQLCETKDGRAWTGNHSRMDELCCLAFASGLGQWCLPRAMWHILPGNVPYVMFNLQGISKVLLQ